MNNLSALNNVLQHAMIILFRSQQLSKSNQEIPCRKHWRRCEKIRSLLNEVLIKIRHNTVEYFPNSLPGTLICSKCEKNANHSEKITDLEAFRSFTRTENSYNGSPTDGVARRKFRTKV